MRGAKSVTLPLGAGITKSPTEEGIYYKTVTAGMQYGAQPTVVKEDAVFQYWCLSADGNGREILRSTLVSTPRDHTLYAVYDPIIRFLDFEQDEDLLCVSDNLQVDLKFSRAEYPTGSGNHMLKVDSTSAVAHAGADALLWTQSVMFQGISAQEGQYLSFDIQLESGTIGGVAVHYARGGSTMINNLKISAKKQTIGARFPVETNMFRIDYWGMPGWIMYVDNVTISDYNAARTLLDFEAGGGDIQRVKDAFGNFGAGAFTTAEMPSGSGNHMLKVSPAGAGTYGEEEEPVLAWTIAVKALAGQWVSFDIQSAGGAGVPPYGVGISTSDGEKISGGEITPDPSDPQDIDGNFVISATPRKIVAQLTADTVFLRFEARALDADYKWTVYIDDVFVSDTDPRLPPRSLWAFDTADDLDYFEAALGIKPLTIESGWLKLEMNADASAEQEQDALMKFLEIGALKTNGKTLKFDYKIVDTYSVANAEVNHFYVSGVQGGVQYAFPNTASNYHGDKATLATAPVKSASIALTRNYDTFYFSFYSIHTIEGYSPDLNKLTVYLDNIRFE